MNQQGQTPFQHQQVQSKQYNRTDETHFLADNGEDEVRMLFRNEMPVSLHAALVTLPSDLA